MSCNDFSEPDDSQLIREAQKGSISSFQMLVRRYQKRAYYIAFGFVSHREEALDICQEAFIRCCRALKKFNLKYKFYPWFHKILKNLCINFLKKKQRSSEVSFDCAFEECPFSLQEEKVNPALLLISKELKENLWRMLNQMKLEDREILVLKHFQDMSYAEIAETLEIPIGTVMSRLYNARRKLKEKMEKFL